MKKIFYLIILQILIINQITLSQASTDSLTYLNTKKELLNYILKDTIEQENIKVIKDKNIFFNKKRDYLKIGISAAFSVGGTITSYILKNEAIENNDLYQQTNIQEYYDKSRKYDIYFALSMAATQIAFSALIYFLFFE
ncbi:MAG: hypothetical protein N2490_09000 [Ignavibacteria bacterium]|nr:hypothetical protein [Ignavibacteria bacterium]